MKKIINSSMLMPVIFVAFVFLILSKLKGGKGKKIDELSTEGATLSIEEAKGMAEGFLSSMASYGTDENEIYDLFERIQTQANFNLVYKMFGLHGYYEDMGLEDTSVLGFKKDLIYWLNAELLIHEKKTILSNFPNIKIF